MISDDQIYKSSIRFETKHFLVHAGQPQGNSWLNCRNSLGYLNSI